MKCLGSGTGEPVLWQHGTTNTTSMCQQLNPKHTAVTIYIDSNIAPHYIVIITHSLAWAEESNAQGDYTIHHSLDKSPT